MFSRAVPSHTDMLLDPVQCLFGATDIHIRRFRLVFTVPTTNQRRKFLKSSSLIGGLPFEPIITVLARSLFPAHSFI